MGERVRVRGIVKRKNISLCKKLRVDQTEAERRLWSKLRDRRLEGIKFRRQFAVDKYILDFYAPEYQIGIEADGGQHYCETGEQYDSERTKKLSKIGIQIIRFSDTEILKNIEGVCEVIKEAIVHKRRQNHPSP